MAAATGADEKKAIKDLTLVFCRRERSPIDPAQQGETGLFFFCRYNIADANIGRVLFRDGK